MKTFNATMNTIRRPPVAMFVVSAILIVSLVVLSFSEPAVDGRRLRAQAHRKLPAFAKPKGPKKKNKRTKKRVNVEEDNDGNPPNQPNPNSPPNPPQGGQGKNGGRNNRGGGRARGNTLAPPRNGPAFQPNFQGRIDSKPLDKQRPKAWSRYGNRRGNLYGKKTNKLPLPSKYDLSPQQEKYRKNAINDLKRRPSTLGALPDPGVKQAYNAQANSQFKKTSGVAVPGQQQAKKTVFRSFFNRNKNAQSNGLQVPRRYSGQGWNTWKAGANPNVNVAPMPLLTSTNYVAPNKKTQTGFIQRYQNAKALSKNVDNTGGYSVYGGQQRQNSMSGRRYSYSDSGAAGGGPIRRYSDSDNGDESGTIHSNGIQVTNENGQNVPMSNPAYRGRDIP